MTLRHRGLAPPPVGPPAGPDGRPEGQYLGICSTCDHAASCGWRTETTEPIQFCEMYLCPVSAPAPISVTGGPDRPEGGRKSTEYKGLCTNCRNRRTCTYPKPAGGVWHCREYR